MQLPMVSLVLTGARCDVLLWSSGRLATNPRRGL